MTIAQALKQKNKLAGEIARLRTRIKEYNVVLDNNAKEFDTIELLQTAAMKQKELQELKAKIATANVPVARQMAEMSELKSYLSFLREVNTKSGTFTDDRGYGRSSVSVKYTPQITAAQIVDYANVAEARIDTLQNELDQFNHTHEI